METTWSFRHATEDDLMRVVEIEKRAHVATHNQWTVENFKAELTKPYADFILLTDDETDSKIAGFIVYWLLFDECQILNIVVDLPYRGLGFAKRMMKHAVQQAIRKGLKKVVLDVRKSNAAAIQLYQGLNFTITHIRKGFYADGEDAYQMTLDLNTGPVLEF